MNGALILALKEAEPWLVKQRAAEIIIDFLDENDSLSPAEVALELHVLNPSKRVLIEGERAESPEFFLAEFWNGFVQLMQQVPYHHHAQERAVNLVRQLKTMVDLTPEVHRALNFWI
jgi:hypothetical protein